MASNDHSIRLPPSDIDTGFREVKRVKKKDHTLSDVLDRIAKRLFARRDSVVFNSVFLLIYAAVFVAYSLVIPSLNAQMGGIAAQLLVVMSVYTVIQVRRYGYLLSVFANLVNAISIGMMILNVGRVEAWPGVVVSLITILLLTIIEFFIWQLDRRFTLITQQTEELRALNKDISQQEEELATKNGQLIEYTEALRLNEQRLHHLANFDLLTELPNRDRILSQLDLLTGIMVHRDMSFSLIFLDLDNFKRINDTLGHQGGDTLLKLVAIRLKEMLHPDDMLGRMGSDEFGIIVQRKLSESEITAYVEKIRVMLLVPFSLGSSEIPVTASFGIAVFPKDGTDRKELMTNADTALHKAKEIGRNSVQFFRLEMKEDALTHAKYERSLLTSIQKNELYLMYQPQFETSTQHLRGFETLVRWESPQFGLVSPGRFITIAETAGFIVPMGEWILRTACRQFKALQEDFGVKPMLSVNISAIQIMTPGFVDMVSDILDETSLAPEYLELEITESVFINSLEYVAGVIRELHKLGVRIALDDFGTGYSSLSYLRLLPFETLKIDKTFIDSINTEEDGKCLVASIIQLMHQLGMAVVAEGVDNEKQLSYLHRNRCDYIQGYIWSRPLDEEAMRQLTKDLLAP